MFMRARAASKRVEKKWAFLVFAKLWSIFDVFCANFATIKNFSRNLCIILVLDATFLPNLTRHKNTETMRKMKLQDFK